jgi:type VI secretion system secreted protein Hcp
MKNPLTRFSSTLALVAPTVALFASHADAAVYIKFDGVDGESASVDHKGWIIIESMSWGGITPVSGTGGGGAGKVSFKDFSFSQRINKASPKLFLMCATGQTVPTVTLSVTRMVGGAEVGYYKVVLKDVLISSISGANTPGAGGTATSGDRPQESLSLNFTKIEVKYTPIDDVTGAQGPTETSGEIAAERVVATN